MCFTHDEEPKAFAIVNDGMSESTFYVSEDTAFRIARDAHGLASVYIGNALYRFKYGEPILRFAEGSLSSMQGSGLSSLDDL